MKIRTLLIIGLFSLAFTPLLLFVGLNMPRVLAQFNAAEENRQLLLIQGNAREIFMTMKWQQNSMKALSFNIGAVELVSKTSTNFPEQVIRKRLQKMVVQWYQDNPEVLAIRLFDRQGMEHFAVRRNADNLLTEFCESNNNTIPSPLIALAELHSKGEVFNAGFECIKDQDGGQRLVMRMGVGLQNEGKTVGAACLYFDLSSLLDQYAGYLIQYNREMRQYTPVNDPDKAVDLEFPIESYPVNPIMVKDTNKKFWALIPFYADGHIHENVILVYPPEMGSTMIWVEKWRKQVLILFGLVLLTVCLIAVKLSSLIDCFLKELLASFQALLRKQQPVDLSWSRPEEMVHLSRDLNDLSKQYIESLRSQEVMTLETQKMENELRQSQKMKALGLLAGGVAHDLNNILSGIVSYPELLLLQLPGDSKLRHPIQQIQESGVRAAAVVADLLTVARGVASKKTSDDLNTLVSDYLGSPECKVLLTNHPDVSCCSDLFAGHLPLFCSPVHVKKVIMNLVTNGIESIRDNGQVIVSTRREQQIGQEWLETDQSTTGYAVLQVQDNGPGIEQKDLEHIFEPFYSKKQMGRSGTGLGLTVVWNTMNDHEGQVKVTSNEKGTCFELFFPLHQSEEIDSVTPQVEQDMQGNGEHILVIDDEAQQRDLAARILSVYGYQVETASSGEEAVALMTNHDADLLLLDMIMDPGINGHETYRRILEIHPQQKAIIVSGFSESREVEKTRGLGAADFVKKPYSMETLAMTVKQALGK